MIPEELRSNAVAAALGDIAAAAAFQFGELTVEVPREHIPEALRRMKEDLRFEQITSVSGVDRYPAEPRFEVVYHLHSFAAKQRVRLKAAVSGENPEIESACAVYRGADWYERETFDLFGIRFLNHPDLRRILMPDDWPGYPLRKDYSVTGTRY